MVKIDRISAWVLLLVMLSYGVTGYGMTRGLINEEFAREMHFGILGVVGIIAFVIHTAWGIHLALRRNNLWNKTGKILLTMFYVLIISFFLFVHFLYVPKVETNNLEKPVETTKVSSSNTTTTTVFTAETLKPYNGLNGQPAYVAVDGIVYDMSKAFRNGRHHGYSAGQELSAAFHGEHPQSYLKGLTVVGTYK